MASYDWLITNGRVIDPKQAIDRVTHVAIQDSRIAAIDDSLSPDDASQLYDASGQIITPGLKDKVLRAAIYKRRRFSDHAPLTIDYDLPGFWD